MNAIAIDCASASLTVAAQKGEAFMQATLCAAMRQSEKLLPLIDGICAHLGLSPKELDFTAVTLGPGSFTGLRLGLSALKALTLSSGTPLYGLSSLDVYAYPFRSFPGTTIPLVESKDAEFFCAPYSGGKRSGGIRLETAEGVLNLSRENGGMALAAGPGAKRFTELCGSMEGFPFCPAPLVTDGRSMILLAKECLDAGVPPLADYDGPAYHKKSEAEIVLEAKAASST